MDFKKKILWLVLLLFLSLILNISLGSVILPKDFFLDIFFHRLQAQSAYTQILFDYRIPKAIVAILTGIGLSISGLLMQSIFRNPIVGPYVLGISSGGGLGVALLILGGSFLGFQHIASVSISIAAALGSILTLLLIISFYTRTKNAVNLLIIGLMIGISSGAIISILTYFTQADRLQKYVFWSMGNLGNVSWHNILILSIVMFFSLLVIMFILKPINALLLGEHYALSLGINLKKTHLWVIILSGLMVGSITAFVGPIAFVGLAVPHIARLIFKSQMLQVLLPASILIGSILMLLCDTIAQVPGSVLVLPINAITALLGAPLVIYLINRKRASY